MDDEEDSEEATSPGNADKFNIEGDSKEEETGTKEEQKSKSDEDATSAKSMKLIN